MKRLATFIITTILVCSLFPMHQVLASQQTTSITSFVGGYASQNIDLNGSQSNNSVSVDIPRNVTFTSVGFDIEFSQTDASPGQVMIDMYEDGVLEWDFSRQGYGNIGEQSNFYNGNDYYQSPVVPGNNSVPALMLPSSAILQSSSLDVSFSSEVGGGFFGIGEFIDVTESDIDSDGYPEPLFLLKKDSNNTSKILWADWNLGSGISLSPQIQTCDNATSISVGDVNNDNRQDIVAFSIVTGQTCVHLANNTSFDPVLNIPITDGLLIGKLGNINSDLGDDFVTVNTSGFLNYYTWNNTTTGLDNPISQVIYPNGSEGMPANIRALHVTDFFGNGKISALVGDVSGHWTYWEHFNTSGGWGGPLTEFDDISQQEMLADLDNDGDIDLVGLNDLGYALRINNGSQWNLTEGTEQIDVLNSTITDFDNDGILDILTPVPGIADGNNQTIEGNITLKTINETSVGAVSSLFLEPWSVPTSIIAMDMDSDGIPEQVIGAGETDIGVFIGSWHSISLDADGDGNSEMTSSGYAGDSANGLDPLVMSDNLNGLKDDLAPLIQVQPTLTDGYGISMVNYSMKAVSSGVGSFNYSNLEIRYDCSFRVESNPYATANLTNVFNQGMTPGTGTYNLVIPVNSTSSGRVSLSNLAADYVPGAPNLALPITPTIQLVSLSHTNVTIEWNDVFDFGPDLLGFELFRISTSNSAIDLANPFANTMLSNLYIDTDISSGSTYTYIVRSVHEFGVTSNLSSPLQVTIPYPAPPASIQGVNLTDVYPDMGGELHLSWSPSSETISNYEVYLETFPFTGISNLTPVKTIYTLAMTISETNLSGLIDGQAYWASVVAVDTFGNRSNIVSSVGPTYPRNDTTMNVELFLEVSNNVSFNSPFSLQISSKIDGVEVNLTGDIVIEMETNSGTYLISENWETISLDNFSQLVEDSANIFGQVTFWANYSGHIGDEIERPKSSAIISSTVTVMILADFTAEAETLNLDSQNMTTANITLQALESVQQSIMQNAGFEWTAYNFTNNISVSGSAQFTNSTQQIEFELDGGGILFINLTGPDWIDTNTRNLELVINPFVTISQNSTQDANESEEFNWEPTEMLDIVIDCGQVLIDPAEDTEISCNATNPNNYSVEFTLIPDGWSQWSQFIQFKPVQNQSTFVLSAFSGIDFEIEVQILQNLSANNLLSGKIELDLVQSTIDYDTFENVPNTYMIQWNLVEENIVDEPDQEESPTNQSEQGTAKKSTNNNLVLIASIGGVAVLVLVVIIVLRIRNSDVEDWDEDDLDLEPNLESKGASKPLPVGVALDDFEDRSITDDSPDRPDIISEFEKPSVDHTSDEYDEDYEEEDSGITVDEHGTEWYEDEVGVWWFREPGEEDWSEFVE